MTTVENLKIQIEKLIITINKLSLGELHDNQQELFPLIEKLDLTLVDFKQIIKIPSKPFDLDLRHIDKMNNCEDRVIIFFRNNNKFFSVDELSYDLNMNKNTLRMVLRTLEKRKIIYSINDKVIKSRKLWRIVKK